MTHNRRNFLQLSLSAAAGVALTGMACKNSNKMAGGGKGNLGDFGLQLYTLRDDLPKDPKGVLKQVADAGYKQIESFEGKQGIFWGMSNTEFKKYMDDLGMKIVSSHCDYKTDFERKAAEAAAIGMSYLMCPYLGPQKSLDDYKKAADVFNEKGEVCKKNGIRFAYHNHDYSFKLQDGQYPQDIMMQGTNADTVDFEMDIYWVVAAGQDPEAWMQKYKNRFRLCHVKDRSKTPVTDNGKNSVDLGTGNIDYAKILKTAEDNGLKYKIVEQEAYPTNPPLEAIKVDATYMSNLKI